MFSPLNLPDSTPRIVQSVIEGAIRPYLVDVHAMLLLPTDDSLPGVGCNFAVAQILLAMIGGVSAVLYSAAGGSGKVFKGFVRDFYPWNSEPADRPNVVRDPVRGAAILYDDYRNPLAHASGIAVFSLDNNTRREFRPRAHRVRIDRVVFNDRPHRGLTEQQLLELESEPVRPHWVPATIAASSESTILTVEALYWGLREAIRRLCEDKVRMEAAMQFFAPLHRSQGTLSDDA